ncbi:hypothetical protein BCR43DRAFT_133840 [Syncephalastrum racemosum]|uniref:Uncharacterized protein n=1 Tax=Syncephalastrum racemosum TaxID=13706 RepID=A0A1X2HLJ9_SYNRA|nr:hypothetical protein BCR43DRAFT_133840 [Syncephalastrum racemosum]
MQLVHPTKKKLGTCPALFSRFFLISLHISAYEKMHFFSNNIKDAPDTFFHCEWLNDLRLNEAQPNDLDIFKFVLTDLRDYWPGTVKRKELESFKKTGGSMEKMSTVVKAACQGAATFDNEALQWKVDHKKDSCKITLITLGDLEFELGHFTLSKAPASQRHTHHLEWMQTAVTLSSRARVSPAFINKRLTLITGVSQETDEILTERTRDLEAINAKLQSTIQSLTDSKVESELNIFMEFKEILNAKKQKIHWLETKLKEMLEQQLGVASMTDHAPEPASEPANTTTTKKRKQSTPKAPAQKKR